MKWVAKIKAFFIACVFLAVNPAFPYGKEFSFRIKVEPPESSTIQKFQVVFGGAKINFSLVKNTWSDWAKVSSEDITAIKKGYPNLYLGRLPLVMHMSINPCVPDTKVYIEFDIDGKQYSSEALSYASGPMSVGMVQWEEAGIPKIGTMAQYNQKYWKHIDEAASIIGEIKKT